MDQSSWTTLFSMIVFCLARSAAGAQAISSVVVTLNNPSFPNKPGYHILKATAHIGSQSLPFACGLFLPPAYFKTTEKMPIVMSLHTRGNSGADGGGGLVGEGLGLLLASGRPDTRGTGEKPQNPLDLPKNAAFIGLLPQCPAAHGWNDAPVPQILAQFITVVAQAGRGDEDRAYLTGFSYGGSSTWAVAVQVPERFAAIVPLDGRATRDPINDMKLLRDVAIYESVGGDDPDFIPDSHRMRDALLEMKHPRFVYHVVPGGNHWCYGCVYTDPQFWTWLFAQRRHGKVLGASAATQAFR